MSELSSRAQQSASVWRNNPLLVHLLGLSPVLALSNSLTLAIALVVCSAVVASIAVIATALIRNPLSATWRFVWYLLVMALTTTLLASVLQNFWPALHQALGLYLPLISCNFALLLHLDSHPAQAALSQRLRRTAMLLAGYALAVLLFATLRELLGSGSLLANAQLLMPGASVDFSREQVLFPFLLLQPGGLILLGLLVAASKLIRARISGPTAPAEQAVTRAKRARVTEKL